MTLTFDPLTLKLVHGVLVSQGPFLPSLVFVGFFVFPLGVGTGQTDRQTDSRTGSTHDVASFWEGWPPNNPTLSKKYGNPELFYIQHSSYDIAVDNVMS